MSLEIQIIIKRLEIEIMKIGIELDKIHKEEREKNLNFMPDGEFSMYSKMRKEKSKSRVQIL